MTVGLVERAGVKGTDDGCRSVICTFTRIRTRTRLRFRERSRIRTRRRTCTRRRRRTRLRTRIRKRICKPSYVSVRHPYLSPPLFLLNPRSFLTPPVAREMC